MYRLRLRSLLLFQKTQGNTYKSMGLQWGHISYPYRWIHRQYQRIYPFRRKHGSISAPGRNILSGSCGWQIPQWPTSFPSQREWRPWHLAWRPLQFPLNVQTALRGESVRHPFWCPACRCGEPWHHGIFPLRLWTAATGKIGCCQRRGRCFASRYQQLRPDAWRDRNLPRRYSQGSAPSYRMAVISWSASGHG